MLSNMLEVTQGMEVTHYQPSKLQESKTPQDVHSVSASKHSYFWYGKANHSTEKIQCYFRLQACHKCGKLGHVAKVCCEEEDQGEKEENKTNYLHQEDNPDPGLFTIEHINCLRTDAIHVSPQINGTTVCMEFDMGASVLLVSERVWREMLNAVPALEPPSLGLKTCTREPLELLGQAHVHVVYEDQSETLSMSVVLGDDPSLFGRNWLGAICLNWEEIKKVHCTFDNLMEQYVEVFRDELETVCCCTVKLMLKENAKPNF